MLAIADVDNEIYGKITNTKFDCFYKDDIIALTLQEVYRMLEEENKNDK